MLVKRTRSVRRLGCALPKRMSSAASSGNSDGRMPVFYSPGDYTVALPAGHRFPMERYAATHATLRQAVGLPAVPTPPAYYSGPRPEGHATGSTAAPDTVSVIAGFEHITAKDWRAAEAGSASAASAWHAAPKGAGDDQEQAGRQGLASGPSRTGAAGASAGSGTAAGSSLLSSIRVAEPRLATAEECAAGHTTAFVTGYANGFLPSSEYRRIGFDWSAKFVQRTLRITGGTIEAAKVALSTARKPVAARGVGASSKRPAGPAWTGPGGVACNGAGGTHHGFPRHGEGFCVVNDASVAARLALYHPEWRAAYGIRRVLILDLDVHQGNGTAACFGRGWRESCEHRSDRKDDPWAGLQPMGSARVGSGSSGQASGSSGGGGTGPTATGAATSSGGSGAALVSADEYSEALLKYEQLAGYDSSAATSSAGAGPVATATAASPEDGTFDVLTVSVHGAKNYPWSTRYPSVLDVDVPDGTGDDEYATLLNDVLARVEQLMTRHSPAQLAVLQRCNELAAWNAGIGSEVLPPRALCDIRDSSRLPAWLQPAAEQVVGMQRQREMWERDHDSTGETTLSKSAAGGAPAWPTMPPAGRLPDRPESILGPLPPVSHTGQPSELGSSWFIPGQTLLLYQAGVDPLRHDRLGRLGLSRAGLHSRNDTVFRWAERWNLPTVVTMGGGYSKPIEASARAHTDVFLQAAASWKRRQEAWARLQ